MASMEERNNTFDAAADAVEDANYELEHDDTKDSNLMRVRGPDPTKMALRKTDSTSGVMQLLIIDK